MKNVISIVEIPVIDFERAVAFYSALLKMDIDQMEMDGSKLGVFPTAEGSVSAILIKGPDYKPSREGALLYLNAETAMEAMLETIVSNGGEILVPKIEISPEMGFYAVFIDSEGNKMGLHGY